MESQENIKKVIACPHCKWEYLPSEILYPDQVLGKVIPSSIVRDPLGHILYEEYEKTCEPIFEDKYICDNCGKPFLISIDTNFKTREESEELDFSEDCVKLW